MSGRFDLAADLAAGVRDKDSAWTFIRRFAEAWMTPLRDGDGYTAEELNAGEQRLGLKLPAALREAYMLFGKRADLCGTLHFLQPPDELRVDEDSGLLLYQHENQGVWERYIRVADLDMDDPPTVQSSDCDHGEHQGGIAWTERLSTACIEMMLVESACLDGAREMYGELLENEIADVERRFTPLALPPLPIGHMECAPASRWYVGEDVIVSLDRFHFIPDEYEHLSGPWHRPWSRAGLRIHGRTPEAIDAMRETLPREWFHWEWPRLGDPYPPKP
ncbi:hypothetical protein AAH991_23030 [Microbispora sp. ZYX-F-249]|uniref:SMI1/KNR4 family protein n=1 Tax=Microbispora maris TaxID=3144104 RepID=A0ABV0AV03_9ACTN